MQRKRDIQSSEIPEIPLAESGSEYPLNQLASAGGQLNTSQAG